MAKSPTEKQPEAAQSSKRNEILIATIGLVGVLTTAALSNWDKMFPPANEVKSTFSGYQPTGDPQVELRYFTEVTGLRDTMRQMQMGIIEHFRKQAEAEGGANKESLAKVFKILEEEIATQYDEMMNIYVPIASKYLSIAEVQDLNKFYSTPVMRELLRKQPLMNKEFLPVAMVHAQKMQERFGRRVKELMEAEEAKERQLLRPTQ